jgi:hypothetical protein
MAEGRPVTTDQAEPARHLSGSGSLAIVHSAFGILHSAFCIVHFDLQS